MPPVRVPRCAVLPSAPIPVRFGRRKNGTGTEALSARRSKLVETGVELLSAASPSGFPEPAGELPAVGPSRVPEATREELTAEVLRASILEYGCLLVRGLLDRDRATGMAGEIERAFTVREELGEGESDADGYYDELQVDPPFAIVGRPWVGVSGGLFAADSPQVMFEMLDCFEEAGLKPLIEGYLGEAVAFSAEKTTLRRTTADLPGGWHQDGKFLGEVRALNLWLSLSRCGDVAPGLDIVPRRLDSVQETTPVWVEDETGTGEGKMVDLGIDAGKVEELAGPGGVSRPIFEPGDALLFDDLFLHSTGSDPSMAETRYAIESWFFAPSAFPESYVPLAL